MAERRKEVGSDRDFCLPTVCPCEYVFSSTMHFFGYDSSVVISFLPSSCTAMSTSPRRTSPVVFAGTKRKVWRLES